MKKRIRQMFLMIVSMIFIFGISACGKSLESQIAKQLELGEKYLTEGKYEEAIVALSKVIELDPKQIVVYGKLADAYIQTGDLEKAGEILDKGSSVVQEFAAEFTEEQIKEFKEQSERIREKLKTAGGSEKEQAAEIKAYDIYKQIYPLFNWNLEMGELDRPVLSHLDDINNRKALANICFIYMDELCPDSGLENLAEHYASYNRVFSEKLYGSDDEEFVFRMDKAQAEADFHSDWCVNLDLSGEEYEYFEESYGYRIDEAYKLDKLNAECRELLGESFKEFQPEELQSYNFFYDSANGVVCRKEMDFIGVEVYPSGYSIHPYIHGIKQNGKQLEFDADYCMFHWKHETTMAGVSYEDEDHYYNEIPKRNEIRPGAAIFYAGQYLLRVNGKDLPLLATIDPGFSDVEYKQYKEQGLNFVDFDHEEKKWIDNEFQRVIDREEVFDILQKRAGGLLENNTYPNEFYSAYTCHITAEIENDRLRIKNIELKENRKPKNPAVSSEPKETEQSEVKQLENQESRKDFIASAYNTNEGDMLTGCSTLYVDFQDGAVPFEQSFPEGTWGVVKQYDLNGDGKEEIILDIYYKGSTYASTETHVYEVKGKEVDQIVHIHYSNIKEYVPELNGIYSSEVKDGKLFLNGEGGTYELPWERIQ